jgi:alpha/beta hydrolase fold
MLALLGLHVQVSGQGGIPPWSILILAGLAPSRRTYLGCDINQLSELLDPSDPVLARLSVAPALHRALDRVSAHGEQRPRKSFPQTHLMWRHVAIELASSRTVICPDLRGYGDSDKPAATDPTVYCKRTMAADVITLARQLGHEQFARLLP